MKTKIGFSLAVSGILFASLALGGGQQCKPGDAGKPDYPFVHYEEVVFTDMSRVRNGALFTGGTPANGFRLIDVRVFRPAKNKGLGAPISLPSIPRVFSGEFLPDQPLVTSAMKFQQFRTWSNNLPINKQLPVIVLAGDALGSLAVYSLAENIAAAGFIVLVPSGYGSDLNACPTPPIGNFCAPAVARTLQRDVRVVINAVENGTLNTALINNGSQPLQVKTDSLGPIVGCAGGSAGGSTCTRAAAGASTTDVNSLPGETAADLRIRAVFSGDAGITPSATFNNLNFTAALATYGSILGGNWPARFAFYNTAPTRIFYDLTNAEHLGIADPNLNNLCQIVSEITRVRQQGINTPHDDAMTPLFQFGQFGPALARCASDSVSNAGFFPPPLPSSLDVLIAHAPTSGISYEADGKIVLATNYYIGNFFKAILQNDSRALKKATMNIIPGLIDNIYVNAVPGSIGNNFNLQNRQIDLKLDAKRKQFTTTIVPFTGPITVEPGAVSLFGDAGWPTFANQPGQVTLAMGNFPLPRSSLIGQTPTIEIDSAGYLSPESTMGLVDGTYAPRRLDRWFADRGSWTIACGGNLMASNIVAGDPVGGRIWVANTPNYLRVTWYQVRSLEFNKIISLQCTLYPDGSVQIVHDDSIPAVLTANNGVAGAMVVGISSGRLHVNKHGKYDPKIKPKIVTFNDVLNGKSTKNADAIYEEYREERAPVGVQPKSCQDD